jgi:alpha-glucosidase (family GH31 glycosyl hydrolase)
MDLGIDGSAEDFGEAIGAGMQFANGQLGEAMHSQYPVLYHRATREAVDRYQAAHPDREIWYWTRSVYSGSVSYEGGNFPGDNSADFGRANGLASSAPDMLNRGIGGAYGFVN